MTAQETLAKAREITQGTTCFVMPVRGRYKVCRRVAGRVIPLGYRADATQLCAWLRKLTQTKGHPAPIQPVTILGEI